MTFFFLFTISSSQRNYSNGIFLYYHTWITLLSFCLPFIAPSLSSLLQHSNLIPCCCYSSADDALMLVTISSHSFRITQTQKGRLGSRLLRRHHYDSISLYSNYQHHYSCHYMLIWHTSYRNQLGIFPDFGAVHFSPVVFPSNFAGDLFAVHVIFPAFPCCRKRGRGIGCGEKGKW